MARGLRLVYLLSSLETGGAQSGMLRLLDGLPPGAFNVTVVALQVPEPRLVERIPNHIRFVDLGVKHKLRLDRLCPLWSELATADVLVCSLYHATVIGRLLGRLRNVPTIVNWHHNERFQGRLRPWVYALTNPLVDAVLADSEAVSRSLQQRYGNDLLVTTVPIAGVDVDRFKSVKRPEGSSVHVGTLGTLTSQKNHDQVLAVAERLPALTFHVAGDGPRRNVLERRVARRGLSNVEFHGYVENVPKFLASLDIYFQPSLYEGLCITVIEAMACRLPVVGSAVGGITDSVLDGETGFLAAPEETGAFVTHLERLADSPELRDRLGDAGRARVEERYSQRILVDSFIATIERAASDA